MDELPHIPDEINSKIFSFLDLQAVRKVREVSKLWKSLIPYACPNLRFVCQLTDDTFTFAVDSEEKLACLDVHDFSGKGNEVVSPTRGSGFLFGNADNIKFTGSNIEPGEIPKMMQFAVDSVKILEFKDCAIDTVRLFIEAKQTFNAVKELSIAYTQLPKVNDTLALEGFATPELGPLLPSLERLKILLDSPGLSMLSCQNIFSNYLAIGKLIMKHRRSLKDIDIERTSKFRSIASRFARAENFAPTPAQNAQFQQCLEAFQEMAIDKLNISPENAEHIWTLETELLRRQQHLKEIVIDNTVVYILEFPDLTTMLPSNRSSLTSVKMTFQFNESSGPVDLGAFRACPNLKSLWLEPFQRYFRGREADPIWTCSSQFSNLEVLPKTISSLCLKFDNKNVYERNRKHQLLFCSPEQITWIVNNLRDLESLWVQLVLDPRTAGQQNTNRRPNMNLQTFNDVIALPKLKTLKLDMMKVNQLQASFNGLEDVVEDANNEFDFFVTPLGEIQDYIDVCGQETNVTSVSRYPVQSKYFKFWELTIHTSNST